MSLTAGYSIDCTKAAPTGGLSDIWLANVADITSFTLGSGNDYASVTMVATKKFFKFGFDPESAGYKETMKHLANGANSWDLALDLSWAGVTQDKIDRVAELAATRCGICIIVQDTGGTLHVFGEPVSTGPKPRLLLTANESSSGMKFDDTNEEKFTIGGRLFSKHHTFSGAASSIPV
jgi:hypothetical protein